MNKIPDVVIMKTQGQAYELKDQLEKLCEQRAEMLESLKELEGNILGAAHNLAEVCHFLDQVAPGNDPWSEIDDVMQDGWQASYPFSEHPELVKLATEGKGCEVSTHPEPVLVDTWKK